MRNVAIVGDTAHTTVTAHFLNASPQALEGNFVFDMPPGSVVTGYALADIPGALASGKLDAAESRTVAHARGGSWWCSAASCHFFNSYDIGQTNIHASFSNQGFRVVRPAPTPKYKSVH